MARQSKVGQETIEYKNVTSNETMFLEVYSEEDTKHKVQLNPGNVVFLIERDIRNHKNDSRFLDGKIVPAGSEADYIQTSDISDIANDQKIYYFIKNTIDDDVLKEKIKSLKNTNTVNRLLEEAKKAEHKKTYSFVSIIEIKLKDLIKEQDNMFSVKKESDDAKGK